MNVLFIFHSLPLCVRLHQNGLAVRFKIIQFRGASKDLLYSLLCNLSIESKLDTMLGSKNYCIKSVGPDPFPSEAVKCLSFDFPKSGVLWFPLIMHVILEQG